MLALDFVRANRETVERAMRDKGVALSLDELLALDTQIRALKTEIEALRAERNAISAQFPKAAAEEKAELGRKAKEAGARVSTLEDQLAGEEAALNALMLQLPESPSRARRWVPTRPTMR
jgi:seryl-tRNA synthetase